MSVCMKCGDDISPPGRAKLTNTPKLYTHAQLNKPAPIIAPVFPQKQKSELDGKTVYLSELYNCGEAWI